MTLSFSYFRRDELSQEAGSFVNDGAYVTQKIKPFAHTWRLTNNKDIYFIFHKNILSGWTLDPISKNIEKITRVVGFRGIEGGKELLEKMQYLGPNNLALVESSLNCQSKVVYVIPHLLGAAENNSESEAPPPQLSDNYVEYANNQTIEYKRKEVIKNLIIMMHEELERAGKRNEYSRTVRHPYFAYKNLCTLIGYTSESAIQAAALTHICNFLREKSEGEEEFSLLLDMLDSLERKINKENIWKCPVFLQRLLIKTYALLIERIVFLWGEGIINDIPETLKREQISIVTAIEKVNSRRDPELAFWIFYAIQSLIRLKSTQSSYELWKGRIKNVCNIVFAGYQVYKARDEGLSNLFNSLSNLGKEISHSVSDINSEAWWYEQLVLFNRLFSSAKNDEAIMEMLMDFVFQLPKVSPKTMIGWNNCVCLVYGIMDFFTEVAIHGTDEVRISTFNKMYARNNDFLELTAHFRVADNAFQEISETGLNVLDAISNKAHLFFKKNYMGKHSLQGKLLYFYSLFVDSKISEIRSKAKRIIDGLNREDQIALSSFEDPARPLKEANTRLLGYLNMIDENVQSVAQVQTPLPPNLFIALSEGRGERLDRLEKALETSPIVVVHGLAGTGKNSLVSYYLTKHTSSKYSVYWFNAESDEVLYSQYRKIATFLIPVFEDIADHISRKDVILWVNKWLRRLIIPSIRQRMIVFANVSNREVLKDFLSIDNGSLIEGGNIIITSCNNSWDSIKGIEKIELKGFTPEEAVQFLQKFITTQSLDGDLLKNLAEKMLLFPTALYQIGLYFNKYKHVKLEDYLKRLEETSDLSESQNVFDRIYQSIMNEMVFEKKELVEHFLQLCSFFASDNIPTRWLQTLWVQIEPREDFLEVACQVEKCGFITVDCLSSQTISVSPFMRGALREKNLRTLNAKEQIKFEHILRLLADSCKEGYVVENYLRHIESLMEFIEKSRTQWQSQSVLDFLDILGDYFYTSAQYEKTKKIWEKKRSILEGTNEKYLPSLIKIYGDLGKLCASIDKWKDARDLLEKAISLQRLAFKGQRKGETDIISSHLRSIETQFDEITTKLDYIQNINPSLNGMTQEMQVALDRIRNLPLLQNHKRPQLTDGLDKSANNLEREKLGLDLANNLKELGNLLISLNLFPEAKKKVEKSLKLVEEFQPLSITHGRLLKNLGNLYYQMDSLAMAELSLNQANDVLEQCKKRGDCLTEDMQIEEAAYLNSIGLLHLRRGEMTLAKATLEKSTAIWITLYPKKNHPRLARAINNVGECCLEMGFFKDAEDRFKEAIDIKESAYKKFPSSDLAYSIHQMGKLLESKGQFKDALDRFNDSLAMRQECYKGINHPDIAISLRDIGRLYREKGQYIDAGSNLTQALGLISEFYKTCCDLNSSGNPIHSEMATTFNEIGLLYLEQGDYENAILNFNSANSIQESIYGHNKDSSEIAKTYSVLGRTYHKMGDIKNALLYYEKAKDMRYRIYKSCKIEGKEECHPEIVDSLIDMGGGYRTLDKVLNKDGLTPSNLCLAEESLKKAYEICQILYRDIPNHPQLAMSLDHLGLIDRRKGDLEKNMGNIEQATKHYNVSLDHYTKALDMKMESYGKINITSSKLEKEDARHPALAMSLNNLSVINTRKGELKAAKTLQKKSLAMKIALYGEGTKVSNVASSLHNLAHLLFTLAQTPQELKKTTKLQKAKDFCQKALDIRRTICKGEAAINLLHSLRLMKKINEKLGEGTQDVSSLIKEIKKALVDSRGIDSKS